MPTYEQLNGLDFADLQEAVDGWRRARNELHDLAERARSGIRDTARSIDWEGANADAGRRFIDRVANRFRYAEEQAGAIHLVLQELLEVQQDCQHRLRTLQAEVSEQGLSIDGQGRITVPPEDPHGPHGRPDGEQADVINAFTGRISTILADSAENDTVAARALREMAGEEGTAFAAGAYDSWEDAEATQGREDADEAISLINEYPDLTGRELDWLAEFLISQSGNEYFITHFATTLGADGIAQFWTGVLDERRFSADPQTLESLRAGLGTVLGEATRSDDPAMSRWQEDMIALGYERIDTGDGTGPTGFQVMSGLMSTGDYDPDFLVNYGEALIDWERTGVGWADPQISYLPPELFTRDPLTGYMEALSRTPDAATALFSDTERADYLLVGRDYDHLPQEGGENGGFAARDAIGNALTAATTGMNPDTTSAVPTEHTAAQKQIFADAVRSLSLVDDDLPPEFREPMAGILLNHGDAFMETIGGLPSERPLDRDQLFDVVTQISRDPNTYAQLNDGMNYVLVDYIYEGRDTETHTLDVTGQTVGFLEEARRDAIANEAANDSDNASWRSRWGYHMAGSALNFIPGAGDILQRTMADVPAAAWLSQEQAAIDRGLAIENQRISEAREAQLEALNNVWWDANSEWAEASEGYSSRDDTYTELADMAELGTNASEGDARNQ